MNRRFLTALVPLLILAAGLAVPARNDRDDAPRVTSPEAFGDATLERAEALFAEGSYALARELYRELAEGDPGPERDLWVRFRLADTGWRSAAATASPDSTDLDRARRALEELAPASRRIPDRDRVWAEAQESLGDFFWTRRNARNWGQAWPHYERALDWWGSARDVELARERYMAIVWKAAEPPQPEPYYHYGYYGNQLSDSVLRNVLRITEDPEHRAHASFLIAMNLRRQGGTPGQVRRVADAFEESIETGRSSSWYDDALYHYGEWLTRSGRTVRMEGGAWRQEPDFVRALQIFGRLTTEFEKGETRYFDDAVRQIENIAAPQLGVAVPQFYLPGSEIRYQLSWRNVREISLTLTAVDLTEELGWDRDTSSGQWLERIRPRDDAPRKSWSWSTNDAGLHLPGNDTLTIDEELARGAYLLEARADGKSAREVVLVTGASVVLKTANRRALAFVCDAITGEPRGDAEVSFWIRSYDRVWSWSESSVRTNGEGLVSVELPEVEHNVEIFVAAADGEDQAIAASSRWGGRRDREDWRLYVFTDRPAYRPGDRARWKVVARNDVDAVYTTPAGREIRYEITDPRGAKLGDGTLELNRFGSAWGETELGAAQPLGEYRVTFHDGSRTIGGAVLLRLEEYKLPEFRVEVRTPETDGVPVALGPDDPVEADIRAEYYFGGPVADATVEVLVYQRPLWIDMRPGREFPWFYEDMLPRRPFGGGQGQIVHRETLTTGADGRATVRFEPPYNPSQDFEYTIEARVTDASRREIRGSGSVRSSRRRYFAFLEPSHNLHRPGDAVEVTVRTRDANERPFAAEGRVRVTRDRWVESDGRRPAGYEHHELLSRRLTTGEGGEAELSFTPDEPGFYRVRFSGDEEEPFPVFAETTVWVADPDTVQIGYRPGRIQLLVDADTARAGGTLAVMLSAPVPDSWVLFSVESEGLHDYRVVHMTGTVKLLELEIEERHVPNVFLEAAMVRDGQLYMDSEQVVVPPVDHYLQVDVRADREEYRPRDKGRLFVTTRDHDGNPVSAEVALALVDESIFYIQTDYAADPRQFFYGTKRGKSVLTQSSFHLRRYALADAQEIADERREEQELSRLEGLGYAADMDSGAMAGGRLSDAVMAKKSMSARSSVSREAALAEAPAPSAQAGGADAAVQVRSDFRATALWVPDVVTDANGVAEVELSFPDSLTTWKATARAATAGNRFGQAASTTRTRKPLIVRLQAPRFFVVGDRSIVSAIVNNNTGEPVDANVALALGGGRADALRLPADARRSVRVPAGGERRVDWEVTAGEAGSARLTVTAEGGRHDDAMVLDYPVLEHGIEKFVSRSGKLRGDEIRVTLDLPAERRDGSDSLIVQITPSLAVTMLDALPYLIDYPYGCTEQTMSRFLPAVITARTLEELGLRREQVAGRIFGGIEGAHLAATHPDGAGDLKRLNDMVRDGLRRLYDFQHGDGGWGWWKEGDSDHFMSAYVVWGLGLARDAGVKVDGQVLRRGVQFLEKEIVEAEQRLDLQAWMLHALTAESANSNSRPSKPRVAAADNLWNHRDGLNAYSRALLALSAHAMGDEERARVLARNLANGVTRDRSPDTSIVMRGAQKSGAGVMGTAHWGADGIYWRWSDGPVETTAFALRALLAIDPDSELVEPVTSWLIKNRRGAQWSNTRDTAISVLALTDFLRTSGELEGSVEFRLEVNGSEIARRRIEAGDALGAPSRFEIDPGLLRDGANEIVISTESASGALYFSADTRYFSLEEPITPAGNEIFARRSYEKLEGRPTLLAGYVYDRRPLEDGGSVVSGERVEVGVVIEAKNDYEYLIFEDLKPAGLEAVRVRSGEPLWARELSVAGIERLDGERDGSDYTGRTRRVYQELRDRKVALFVDKLPQGTWEIRYELRAETPGTFHALPLMGHAMYVPEIRCNGAELRLEVLDAARPVTGP